MGHIPMIITASRAADNECEDVAVANLTDTLHTAVVRAT
jgi:hypothetical protein